MTVSFRTASFRVSCTSGTPGDDCVAWGLAIFLTDLTRKDVLLDAMGDHFRLEVDASMEDLLEACTLTEPGPDALIPWLASPEKNRLPPDAIRSSRDRDAMREAAKLLAQARKLGTDKPADGDVPTVVVSEEGADRYPLFRALTSPGTQWIGYNSFAELVQQRLLSAEGRALVLHRYLADQPLSDAVMDTKLKALGLRGVSERWRNPPGFLYPGLNKGPTMRLRTDAGSIGGLGEPDWTLADRGDRDIIQLYLAYVGYFSVARILESKEERIVLVPSPAEAQVPQALSILDQAVPPYSSQEDYLLAKTSLAYAGAALRFWEDLAVHGSGRYPQLLAGVHLGVFWKPNANTYAPRRQSVAPLPSWLAPLRASTGFGTVREVLELHGRRLANVRGPWKDEKRLGPECRQALDRYVISLDGRTADWLWAVAAWFPAARAAEGERRIALWTTDEIRRVLMATDMAPDIISIVDSGAFNRIASSVRRATVFAHYARLDHKRGGGDTPAFNADYDLVTDLSEAAGRHPYEFLHRLFDFIARYNDETMRRNEVARAHGQPMRPLVSERDLREFTGWVLSDRKGLVPAALLAFGTSRLPKREAAQAAAQEGLSLDVVAGDASAEAADEPTT